MVKDMTNGSPMRLLIAFSIPLVLGNVLQQCYSMADAAIVGKTLGYEALAAVGSTGGVMFFVFGFFFGLTSGLSVITAQRFGAGDYDEVRHSIGVSVIVSLITSLAATFACLWATPFILRLMHTPDTIYQQAYDYLSVMFIGSITLVFYGLVSSIIRALGDSLTPLLFLVVSCLLNIGLDLLFIITFHLGVSGAAWATVISQACSVILCIGYVLWRFPILKMHRRDWRYTPRFYLQHLKIALPMAFQFSITAVGVVILQSVINDFGPVFIAAATAGAKIEQLASPPLFALGIAAATFAAQNYGAGKLDRALHGVSVCARISAAFCIVLGVLLLLFSRQIALVFIDSEQQEVIDGIQTYVNITITGYVLLSVLIIYRNALQGLGRSFVPFMAGVVELVFRIIGVLVLVRFWGYTGACLSHPLAWAGAAAMLFIYYIHVSRKMRQQHSL